MQARERAPVTQVTGPLVGFGILPWGWGQTFSYGRMYGDTAAVAAVAADGEEAEEAEGPEVHTRSGGGERPDRVSSGSWAPVCE
jgi:hypothetical protein